MNDTLIGQKLGARYRVLHSIAKGGMGAVYEAEDEQLRRRVAVKLVRDEFLRDPVTLERFRREALAMASVRHPSLVTIFDVSLEPAPGYFVMELLDGPTLSELLSHTDRLPWPRATRIALDLLDALHALHSAGIVHRDLKPSNVVLVREGALERAKIIDLGVARLSSDEHTDPLTWSGSIVGTPSFMAPEQLAGEPVDTRADLYSVGVVLERMLFGAHTPTRGSTTAEFSWPADVAPELAPVLRALLATRPDDRPRSALDARHALSRCVTSLPNEPESLTHGSYGGYGATPRPDTHTRSVSATDGVRPSAKAPLFAGVRARWIAGAVAFVVAPLVILSMYLTVARAVFVPADTTRLRYTQTPSGIRAVPVPSQLVISYRGENEGPTATLVGPQIEPGLRRCVDPTKHALGEPTIVFEVSVDALGAITRIDRGTSRCTDDEARCVTDVLRAARWVPSTSRAPMTMVIAIPHM